MSKRCDVCGKEPSFGRQYSRLGVRAQKRRIKGKSSRMYYPNIQSVKTMIDGTPTRLKACTSCLRKGKITRRAKSNA